MLYGNDFYYDEISHSRDLFKKIEAIINQINNEPVYGMKARLATPSEYFNAVKASRPEISTFRGDFVPLMNTKESPNNFYWTGFYASRPESKSKIAKAHDIVRTGKMLSALVLKEGFDTKNADIGLHHDAITGTNRDHVAKSYEDFMNSAIQQAEIKISEAFLMLSKPDSKNLPDSYKPLVIFNPLNWERIQVVHFETENRHVQVLDSDLKPVATEVAPMPQGGFLVLFNSHIEGLSFNTYFVIEHNQDCETCSKLIENSDDFVMQIGEITLELNSDCFVKEISQKDERVELNSRFFKYNSLRGGAYIFSPSNDGNYVDDINLTSCKVYNGKLASVSFAEWNRKSSTKQVPYTQRLVIGEQSDSVEWAVQVSPSRNEELFMRFDSQSFDETPWFHTFNSGDLRNRIHRNKSDYSVTGMNYYPLPGALVLGKLSSALTLVPEFPTGAGLPNKNRIVDVHLHRNMQQDDYFGLAGKHDDTTITTHTFHMSLGEISKKSLWHKYLTGKHSFQLFSVSLKPFNLSTAPIKDAEATKKPWTYSPDLTIGLSSENVYLSSASWKGDKSVVRMLEFSEHNTRLEWDNLDFIEECNLGGFDKPKALFSLAGENEIFDKNRLKSGHPVALRASQPIVKVNQIVIEGLQSFTARLTLKPLFEATKEIPKPEAKPKADYNEIRVEANPADSIPPKQTTKTEDTSSTPVTDKDDTSAESTTSPSTKKADHETDLKLQGEEEGQNSFLEKEDSWIEETLDTFETKQNLNPVDLASNTQDLEALEYAVVIGLSIIAALSILAYYRYKKRRRD